MIIMVGMADKCTGRGQMYVGIHYTYGMRIIGSKMRLGMYNTRLGETRGRGPYNYDSVGKTRCNSLECGFGSR